jgi:DNA polymerase-1
VNMVIQGTAADLMKRAMIAVHGALERKGLRSRTILQVHDELVLDTPAAEIPVVTALVREEMERAASLDVPLVVDVGTGENWREAH